MSKSWFDRMRGFPIHPLFVGTFSILSLLGHNVIEIAPEEGLRALLASIVLVGLFWAAARTVTGWTWERAALVASLFGGLFFSYGHFYALVEDATLLGLRVGRHLVLGPLWLGILVAGGWGLGKITETKPLTRALNLMGFVLLIIPLYQIGAHEVPFLVSQAPQANADLDPPAGPGATHPDIYYIIPDAYARDDTLLEIFGHDNTPFLQALEDRGFAIPHCSRSNYVRTFLSISSSLNMEYVQEIAPRDPVGLTVAIKDNAVRRKLTREGYTVAAFDSGFFRTQWPDADLWFSYESRVGALRSVTEFETLVMETTGVLFFLDANIALGGAPLGFIYETVKLERYNRVNFILDTLEDLAELPGPKFVFVHIPSPHGPYVISEEGAFSPDPDDTPEGYRGQIVFLNQRILTIVDTILEEADNPPVIVIQGDHGASEVKPDFRRLNILNAYYLPGEGASALYPTITPVNTFRLIFDLYFEEELDLLPDVSYFSPPGRDFAFSIAPDSRPGCEGQE